MPPDPTHVSTFAAAFAALYAAHQVADHWVQTEDQAAHKGLPGAAGRIACLMHVLTYTVTCLVALLAVKAVVGLPWQSGQVIAALAVSAVTHYAADRRTPLARLAGWLGHAPFHRLGAPRPGHDDNPSLGTGAYALDQSLHVFWLFIAALIIAA
jgi:hypothetical protein